MNFLPATIENGRALGPGLDVPSRGTGKVVVGVRPQDLEVAPSGGITMHVEVIEAMGFEAYAHGKVGDASFVARLTPEELSSARVGSELSLTPKRVHAFDPSTERTLSDA
jgi:ABC-type sugar transport system ATPase subunit